VALATNMQGSVSLSDGAKIAVPLWAVPLDAKGGGIAMEFSIAKSAAAPPAPPAGVTAASAVYDLGPGHFTFAQALNVSIPVAGAPSAEKVRIYRIDPATAKLQRFSASYDADAKVATAQTYALSSWFAAISADTGSPDGAFKISNTSATDWVNACVVSRTLADPAQDADFPSGTISVAPTGTIGWASTMNWYLPLGTYTICVQTQTAGTVSTVPGTPQNVVLTGQVLADSWTAASPLTTDLPVSMATATAGPCDCTPKDTPADQIFYNGNIAGVYNQPTAPTVFTTTGCNYVSRVVTYHWNDGAGKTPGTITLNEEGGATYGPWQASGTPGQGGVVDAYWNVYPGIILPAGTYTFVDSDPATWSQNSGTSGTGMAWVEGVPAACP
jgi:hypothetical protein